MSDCCCLCGGECDGSLMRTDPRFTRVRAMLTDAAVPRRSSGGIALCHTCQRRVYWRGGLIPLLAREVKREAMLVRARKRRAAYEQRRAA